MRRLWWLVPIALVAVLLWWWGRDDRRARSERAPSTAAAPPGPAAPEVPEKKKPADRASPVLTGTVKTEDGNPVARASVRALDATVRTDADGVYRVAVSHGSFPVSVEAPGYGRVMRQALVTKPRTRIDFVLYPSVAVEGVVVDQEGAPVAGARLVSEVRPEVATGADGRFRLELPRAGRWRMALRGPPAGCWDGQREFFFTPKDSPLRLTLLRVAGGTLHVDVVDKEGRRFELNLVVLSRVDEFGIPHPREVEDGQIRAENLPPGRWFLRMTTATQRVFERRFEMAPGGAVRLQIVDAARGAIVGHADVSALTSPPRILSLTTRPPHQGVWKKGKPARLRVTAGYANLHEDTGYTFRLDDVPPGKPIAVVATGMGAYGRAGPVTVAPGGEATVTIPMRPGAFIDFVVKGRMPVPRTMFRFWEAGRPDDVVEYPYEPGGGRSRVFVPAGRLRWRCRWRDPWTGRVVTKEGALIVPARVTTDVDLDLGD